MKPLAIVDDDNDELQFDDRGSSDIPAYTYQALPSGNYIRLIELKPGDRGHTLRCDIKPFNLVAFNIPPYDALSYTWGDSKYDRLFVRGNRIFISDGLHKIHSV